ncbi:MAG: Ig-like domain-containing protein [Actinobacteria bacterium]|nr:Ig-like domain-containing protein [Actinomycetota bacterium]
MYQAAGLRGLDAYAEINNGQTGVSLGTNVTATFSEAMMSNTINTSTVQLYQKYWYLRKKKRKGKIRRVWTYRWVPVSASVSCDSSCTTATLDPTNPLVANTNYLAAVTTGAKDASGSALAQAKYWTFTTGTAPGSQQPKK